MNPIPTLSGARTLADRYQAWFCDVWGVVHNGVAHFPAPVAALVEFRRAGGRVAMVTNAPRPCAVIEQQLVDLGVDREAFDVVVTSGDVARDWLQGLDQQPVYHLGPERDRPLTQGLNLNMASPETAQVILCSGLRDDTVETPGDYDDMLGAFAGRGLQMMCANPDIVVNRGGNMVYCAGALGRRYAELGGPVDYAGKPCAPIYDLAFRRLSQAAGAPLDRAQVLAIGDAQHTDIAGASDYGLDSLFTANGIHASEIYGEDGTPDPHKAARLFADLSRPPVAMIHELAW
ncbi:MAG: TIGR01459 family HAD-type hydrolase [Alphaproteobacteria bacterium]